MSRYSLAVTIAAAATVLLTGTAAAQPGDAPAAGDDRATAHAGNVVAADCAELFPGTHAIDLAHSVDATNTYVSITSGTEIVAVVVKGGPAYNVYTSGPWENLHSPLVPSGKPAQISHWFACGGGEESTSTTTTTSSTASTTDTSTPSSSAAVDSVTTATTTTTTPAIGTVAEEGDLASTGFNGGWLIVLGALLLLGRLRGARR